MHLSITPNINNQHLGKYKLFNELTCACRVVLAIALMTLSTPAFAAAGAVYRNPHAPIDQRVDEAVAERALQRRNLLDIRSLPNADHGNLGPRSKAIPACMIRAELGPDGKCRA